MAAEELNSESFNEFIQNEKTVVVDFWAAWCGPCKILGPVLDGMSEKYDGAVSIGKVNVSDFPAISAQYSITSIPCLIVFRGGKEVDRMVGFKGKESLEDLFNRNS